MKLSEKTILIGLVSAVCCFLGSLFIGGILGWMIPGGDGFINSYFFPLFGGIILTCATLISCTYLIINKINLLLKQDK